MTTPLIEALPVVLIPIFIAYAALIVMALIPIFFGSFHALEEVKVIKSAMERSKNSFL